MKTAFIRAAIVLVPSYAAAYLTDKMVYVVPTLAAASFFAASLTPSNQPLSNRVDENDESDDDGDMPDLVDAD